MHEALLKRGLSGLLLTIKDETIVNRYPGKGERTFACDEESPLLRTQSSGERETNCLKRSGLPTGKKWEFP